MLNLPPWYQPNQETKMKTIKWVILPATFLAAAVMLGGCVDMEPDEQADGWVTESDEQVQYAEVDGLAVVDRARPPMSPVDGMRRPASHPRGGYHGRPGVPDRARLAGSAGRRGAITAGRADARIGNRGRRGPLACSSIRAW